MRADQGIGESGLFTTDTRWGFSDGAGVSGFFRVDTRLSGSASDASFGLFTVDTTGAVSGSASIFGNVNDTTGAGLSGATVSALQNSVVRAQTGTDPAGNYQLTSLPAGSYELRATKANYLTDVRYGFTAANGQAGAQNFTLLGKPAVPVVEAVTLAGRVCRVAHGFE